MELTLKVASICFRLIKITSQLLPIHRQYVWPFLKRMENVILYPTTTCLIPTLCVYIGFLLLVAKKRVFLRHCFLYKPIGFVTLIVAVFYLAS